MQRSLACLVVLSTQGQDENAVFAVRLLIHGKERELGDLVYYMLVAPGGCCAAAVDKERSVVDYIHVIVSTHCKYHSVVCSVCATLSVCIALQRWYKLNKVQSYDSLHKDSI